MDVGRGRPEWVGEGWGTETEGGGGGGGEGGEGGGGRGGGGEGRGGVREEKGCVGFRGVGLRNLEGAPCFVGI